MFSEPPDTQEQQEINLRKRSKENDKCMSKYISPSTMKRGIPSV